VAWRLRNSAALWFDASVTPLRFPFCGMVSRIASVRRTLSSLALGDLPLVVLSRGLDASAEQRAAHAEISRMSRNARHLVVADSYHEIHLSHPEVVVKAIWDVVASVRAKAPLP
ncbi:MAG TPA: hypothetical protein VFS23_14390, partial [Vicinamibacterales bacterium]|nr:hypothetical protein [Vicinamibacterales bacterium]